MRVATVIVLAGVSLLAGCSDDQASSETTAPSTTEGTVTDQQIADDAVLVASDVPDGWTAVSRGLDNSENMLDECGAEGAGSVPDDGDPRSAGNWESPVDEAGGFIGSSVEINPDMAQADAILAALRTPEGKECLAASLASALGEVPGQEVGDVELVERTWEGLGDDAIAYRAAVPLSGEGYEVIWFSDLVTVREGRALVGMAFAGQDEPLAGTEQQRLTGLVLDRIPADA